MVAVEFISDTEEVKRLARNVVPADFTTAQIESYQKKEFSYIATITNKDDWALGDREFGALQLVETTLAAADILMHYGDENDYQKGMAMKDWAYGRLDSIEEHTDTEVPSEETEAEVDRTDWRSWNLNPAVPVPNSLGDSNDIEGF